MKENIYGFSFDEKVVAKGLHRSAVGGLWEDIGQRQLDFMVAQGMMPKDTFVDIGCGCLRGGVQFIEFLDSEHYYGCDINASLLDAGYDVELREKGLQDKLPRSHLLATEKFELTKFDRSFDYAFAFSLFTHLTMNSIRRCLIETRKVMETGSRFYATFFVIPDSCTIEKEFNQSSEIVSHMDDDPYHYHLSDIQWLAEKAFFSMRLVEGFEHPRNQMMIEFTPV